MRIAWNSAALKKNTIAKTLKNIIQEARSVPITYEFIFPGSSLLLAVMLAVVAVDDTIPPSIDERMIEEFFPTNFERIYQRYETHDITTTKNQIEYGLKKSNVTSG